VDKRANKRKAKRAARNESGQPAPMPDTMKVVHQVAVAI
jgi:hypothetical protein